MEIAPIPGIRAITLVLPVRADTSLPPVFVIDPSARANDDAYTASRQTPDRGLEEEDSDTETASGTETPSFATPTEPSPKIDCIA